MKKSSYVIFISAGKISCALCDKVVVFVDEDIFYIDWCGFRCYREGIDQSIKIFATIPLPTKIHERELDKTDPPDTFNSGATLGPINQTKMERIWNKNKTNTPLKRKVFVGVSGGVDSSVALALLQKEGYDVTGVFLKVWNPDWMECNWKEERRSAMRVCATLGVPFMTLDCEAEYKKEVVDYMIREYSEGRVPNPDVFCNKFVKFGVFLRRAIALGADYIATGHYAICAQRKSCLPEYLGKAKDILQAESALYELHESIDKEKEQSYFLYTLGQHELSHTLFPVGKLLKSEVRTLARKFGLPTAEKKDSQGLCFIGKVDMKEFLGHYIEKKRGDVLNTAGEVTGYHDGAVLFAIGERHGFTITKKSSYEGRSFVVAKDIFKNTITVANKEAEGDTIYNTKEIIISDLHFISDKEPALPLKTVVRIRYHQPVQGVTLYRREDGYHVIFDIPQNAVSVGQSAVLYDGETCLGGGVIEKCI